MDSSAAPLPAHPEDEARAALDRGDARRALTLLMQAYGRDVHRDCYQVLGDRDLADEYRALLSDRPGYGATTW